MQEGCADFLFWNERSLLEKQDVSEDKKDIAKADVADFIKVVLNYYKIFKKTSKGVANVYEINLKLRFYKGSKGI